MRSFVPSMKPRDPCNVTLPFAAGLALCAAALLVTGCGAAPKSIESGHDELGQGPPPPPPPPPPPSNFMRVGALLSETPTDAGGGGPTVKTGDQKVEHKVEHKNDKNVQDDVSEGGDPHMRAYDAETATEHAHSPTPKSGPPPRGKSSSKVQGAVVDTQATISEDDVRSAVSQRGASFRRCYDLGMAETPSFSGSVTVRIAVSPAGNVASVDLVSTTTKNQQVDACVTEEVKRLMFPAIGGGAVVAFPIEFGR